PRQIPRRNNGTFSWVPLFSDVRNDNPAKFTMFAGEMQVKNRLFTIKRPAFCFLAVLQRMGEYAII
ncbi:MAG: hypothetical protein SPI68_09320, partial [Candidatus Faecousia sp.]|nr:hypothetical protein [Candidatus Faecousia sp.]